MSKKKDNVSLFSKWLNQSSSKWEFLLLQSLALADFSIAIFMGVKQYVLVYY